MKLKICGMKYQGNITEMEALRPDYLGFIFYKKSPRFIEQATLEVSDTIKKTGVFVNASINFINEQIIKHNLKAVQLHGDESPEFCGELRHAELVSASHPIEIIKVFSIKDNFDFSVLSPYESVCDYYLFDTKGDLPGGNGTVFDWTVLTDYPSSKPFFLSGGIGLEQLKKIKEFKKSKASKYCYALDLNSSFEIKPGLKSIEKLTAFKSQI